MIYYLVFVNASINQYEQSEAKTTLGDIETNDRRNIMTNVATLIYLIHTFIIPRQDLIKVYSYDMIITHYISGLIPTRKSHTDSECRQTFFQFISSYSFFTAFFYDITPVTFTDPLHEFGPFNNRYLRMVFSKIGRASCRERV